MKYDLLNAQNENGQVLNIRVYCVDGKVRVLMKYSDEIGFSEVAVFSLENHTPNGKIQIQAYSSGERLAEISLWVTSASEISITMETRFAVTYQSSDLFVPTDYDYKDSWNREDFAVSRGKIAGGKRDEENNIIDDVARRFILCGACAGKGGTNTDTMEKITSKNGIFDTGKKRNSSLQYAQL